MFSLYHDLILLLIGSIAGFLSGLLGIGGGIVVVPALFSFFHFLKFSPQIVMHMAAGTSFAIMVLTTSRSLYSHQQYRVSFYNEYVLIAPGVVIGVALGGVAAHFFHSVFLRWLFIAVIVATIIKTFLPDAKSRVPLKKSKRWFYVGGAIIGSLSGMLGIGGSVFTIPFLGYCGVSFRTSIATAVAVGLTVAVVGAVVTMVMGSLSGHVPAYSIGYVYWPAVILVGLGSVVVAPLGVYFSHKMPVPLLKRVFSIFLMVVAVHMMLHN